MSFVKSVETENEIIESPFWEKILDLIEILEISGNIRSILMEGDNEALMIISYSNSLGFYITARAKNEYGETVLYDESLGEEIVQGLIAGLKSKEARGTFVNKKIAIEAAKIFFERGLRSDKFKWREPLTK